jgi:hypothetical protein
MIHYAQHTPTRLGKSRISLPRVARPATLFDLSPSQQELESILGDSKETVDFYMSYATSDDKLAHVALLYKLREDMESFELYWQQITNTLIQRSLKEYSLRKG